MQAVFPCGRISESSSPLATSTAAVGVGVHVGEHRLAQRSNRLRRPAAAHVVDPAEARLVLEHEPDRPLRPLGADAGEKLGEFFSPPLRCLVTLRLTLVRGQLPPAMPMQKLVHR